MGRGARSESEKKNFTVSKSQGKSYLILTSLLEKASINSQSKNYMKTESNENSKKVEN